MKSLFTFDFLGRPRPSPAANCYLIQAAAFFFAAWIFLSWDFAAIGFVADEAFERPTRENLYSYWKTPWFYWLTFQFVYDFVPRPGAVTVYYTQLIVAGSAALGLIGVAPRLMAAVILVVGSHLIAAFLLAADTVDGSSTTMMFLVLLVAVAPSEALYRINRPLLFGEKSERFHGPPFLLLFYLSTYYFISAINKIAECGFSWFLDARLDWFSINAIEKSIFPSSWWTSLWFSDVLSNYWIATAAALAVFVLELLAPLALFFPRLIAPLFLFFAVMHFSIYLSHGYGYWVNAAADLICLAFAAAVLREPAGTPAVVKNTPLPAE